jgi:RNA polymerase sigma-70 factor, ECF subfamily
MSTVSSMDADTEELLARAGRGDASACQQLLARHRTRLKQMVAVHMDHRVAARIDPSDVVQEALADACQSLAEYLRNPPLPFYPWLRQITWERLIAVHHRHVRAQRRSVGREERAAFALPDESVLQLAQRLTSSGTSPSGHLLRSELRARVQTALAQMRRQDRDVLVMRHLEQLSISEIAAVLGIQEGAVKTRLTRALVRLRLLLADELGDRSQ